MMYTLESLKVENESLVCGIEVHQQLEGKKLFCDCPTFISDDSPTRIVKRKLRAVVGETGVVDVAAERQSLRDKLFLYEVVPSSSCLVDLDESPPRLLNSDALKTAIQVATVFKCSTVDEVQVMRKTVVDGSNTSGFQRTALIGMNGSLVTKSGVVGVQTLVLEEDSARIMKSLPSATTYRLDRLGIPLLEIATAPDIRTPAQAREVAESIGLLVRATGKAKRGLGSIRQDINVSIAGGSRVELKGAQDLRLISDIVTREVLRQKNILSLRNDLKKLRFTSPVIINLSSSSSKIVVNALSKGFVVLGVNVVHGKGFLGAELQPGRRVATDLSDVAKEETGIGGLLHSDELPNYGITEEEKNSIAEQLGCAPDDGFIFILALEDQARKSFVSIERRLRELQQGVPSEVRKVLPDGNSSYLRPMPGASRMYPETDTLPIVISDELLSNIPPVETYDDRVKRYMGDGLGKDLAEKLSRDERCIVYDELRTLKNVNKPYIAEILIAGERTIKSELEKDIIIPEDRFGIVFKALNDSKITKKGVIPLLASNNPILEFSSYAPLTSADIEESVIEILKEGEQLPLGMIIGKVSAALKGRADGRMISEIVQKYVREKKKEE